MKTTPEMIARWTAQIADWRGAGPEYVIAVKPPDLLALLSDLAELTADVERLQRRIEEYQAMEAREWVHVTAATDGYRVIGGWIESNADYLPPDMRHLANPIMTSGDGDVGDGEE